MEGKKGISVVALVLMVMVLVIVIIIATSISKKNKANKDLENNEISNENFEVEEPVSDEEAMRLIRENFDIAEDLFEISPKYYKLSENSTERYLEDGVSTEIIYRIENYEEINNKYITSYCQEYFDANSIGINWVQADAYVKGERNIVSPCGGVEFKNLTVNVNRIDSTVRMEIINPETKEHVGYAETSFSISRNDNKEWQIAKYTSTHDYNNWADLFFE